MLPMDTFEMKRHLLTMIEHQSSSENMSSLFIETCITFFGDNLCLSPIFFNLYSQCLTKETLDGLGDFNIGGQIIQTVKYADDLVLMTKEEKVL